MSFDVLHYLPGLLQVEDRVSMAVSLESRVPLLDHRVVEWAARIPARTRLAGKNLKGILRAAMADLVPEAVISRTDKVGFSVPLGQWIAGELAPRAHHILGCGEGSSRRVWNPAGVKRLIQQQARGEEHGHHFWTMLSLAAWFDIFVDGRVPSYRS